MTYLHIFTVSFFSDHFFFVMVTWYVLCWTCFIIIKKDFLIIQFFPLFVMEYYAIEKLSIYILCYIFMYVLHVVVWWHLLVLQDSFFLKFLLSTPLMLSKRRAGINRAWHLYYYRNYQNKLEDNVLVLLALDFELSYPLPGLFIH